MSATTFLGRAGAAALLAALLAAPSACTTKAYCFADCEGESDAGTHTGSTGSSTASSCEPFCGTTSSTSTGTGGGGPDGGCSPTNGGVEICDGVDNDCDGKIDNDPSIDFASPKTCGTCTNNCNAQLLNCAIDGVECVPSANPGTDPGTCKCNKCDQDYTTIDPAVPCGYFCIKTANDDTLCNNKDDDCDGVKDEDVDLCASLTDCGTCGRACSVLHGTPACVNTGGPPCDASNTQCKIAACDPGFWDLDGSYATGCEYACTITNGGVEICGDGIDNDCDGKIDEADDLSGDPAIGVVCYGAPSGECATPAHAGVTICQANKVVCSGPDVIVAGQLQEICNGKDDDCDGVVDDGPTDVGGACGLSAIAPCALGAYQCVNGAKVCVGAVDPGVEVCNGIDDDCNGTIDDNTADAVGPCGQSNVGECAFGALTCQGGVIACVGEKGPQPETCNGKDDDCDGVVDNSPSGVGVACGTSGTPPCSLGTMQCVNGALSCVGAVNPKPESCNGVDDDCNGVVDDNTPGSGVSCGVSNTFPCKLGTMLCQNGVLGCVGNVDPQPETCNGQDDNCNGIIDDGVTGVGAQCGTTNIGACKLGTIQCNGGVLGCVGAVEPTTELCNGIDDDCNGVVDDNPTGAGAPCGQSSVGACKLGIYQCTGGALTCVGAVNPGTEVCDGIDNDCDGVVDNNPTDVGASCGSNNVFPCSFGTIQCVGGAKTCVGAIDPKSETCNGQDDDCNGVIDDGIPGMGAQCGTSNVGECKFGTLACQGGVQTCAGAVDPTPETCNGKDDDCNGTIDDNPAGIGGPCGQSSVGACKLGAYQCSAGVLTCVGAVNPSPELCNGIDDNCDGVVDNNPTDVGAPCGASNTFPCSFGSMQCVGGSKVCVGAVNPGTETCNGVDDDCDGSIDSSGGNPPSDSVGPCNVPIPPPAGATSACKAGAKACQGGTVQCVGSVTAAPGAQDTCGVDANCDGKLTNQPDTQTDVSNCGACGNDCYAGAVHASWACVSGACVFQGCRPGYYDNGGPGDAVAGDHKCGYACTFVSAQEACNGADDNCNGTIDEGVIAPSPVQVCGISPQASAAECTTGVTVACQNGAWKCTFPAGVCNPTCAAATEICDGLDNDCDGLLNENVLNYGKPCASDDATPVPGDGACRTTGTIVCDGPSAVKCSAVKADCNTLPGGCTELCDGIDNDCDGSIDETYQAKGANPTYFVKPAVTRIDTGLWVYSFEASRPNATAAAPGSGNGYTCNSSPCPGSTPVAPTGVTLDKTKACSVQGKIPWFNVNAIEAEQTCQAMGGRLCTLADWQGACDTAAISTTTCNYGYAPLGAACQSGYGAGKFCNLGPSFDFDQNAANGDQDGLLPTGSSLLQNCYADWTTLLGNTAANGKIFDMTGNLREITKDSSVTPAVYRLMGGSFSSGAEAGSTCQFTFYTVDQSFQLYDLGFRCCFTADPTL